MVRKRKEQGRQPVGDYRYEEARRKNNPPAGIASTYEVRERQVQHYAYDPHLDPQLQWAGKAEHTSFDVDLVSLHIHERISTRAILEAVKKPEPQLTLFADPQLPLDKQIEFYQHDVNWVNRLILGDSLLVMNSLLVKEGMASKVQMIYVDPPYGIKYSSNFQPRIDRRDVKDKDEDLTREPEQIKAYRDTWKLGIHSYLTYLRDRLLLARELLIESGSIFVQINDENLHLVRCLMDEVFGRENFVAVIAFRTRSTSTAIYLPVLNDYLLFYAKDKTKLKFRQLFVDKSIDKRFSYLETGDGEIRTASSEDRARWSSQADYRLFSSSSLSSTTGGEGSRMPFTFRSKEYYPAQARGWRCSLEGMQKLAAAERIVPYVTSIRYKFFYSDFPVAELGNLWEEQLSEQDKVYAVQTATKIIERCILMTTDPGDLVFDPTCGSGATVYCAEKWGRRWITCDTSRVALAIARQRLMTAKYDYYELADPERGPSGGFIYEIVPHITLQSIAHNTEIDEIAAKYQPQIDEALTELNQILVGAGLVPAQKGRPQGSPLREWEVPPVGADLVSAQNWSQKAKEVHHRFWTLKRKKRQEIDASIQRNAPQEVLYDRPQVRRNVVRVSGPFTVEAIPVPVIEDPSQAPIPQFEEDEARHRIADPAGDYLANMLELLRKDGVTFPGGKRMPLESLRPLNLGLLHAEGGTKQNGKEVRVAMSFGPQYGPVTATQVAEAIPAARNNAYDVLIFAGFSFDPEAQAFVQKAPVKGLQVHFANIAPDVLVGDLLKTTRGSQLFTVFGQPDVKVDRQKDGTYIITLRGVDIYDPNTGELSQVRGDDVAAWFLDTDHDGMTFHICQAFFPGDGRAWDKLQRALKAQIEPEAFEEMRGTQSFPFQPGEHERIAVKVIDFRGNEVIRVIELDKKSYGG